MFHFKKALLANLKVGFIFHIIVNCFVSAFVVQLFYRYQNEYMIDGNIDQAIIWLAMATVLEYVSSVHTEYWFEKARFNFKNDLESMILKDYLKWYCQISRNEMIQLSDGNYDMHKHSFLSSLGRLIATVLMTSIRSIPFIGYTVWLFYQTPGIMTVYVIGWILLVKYIHLLKVFPEKLSVRHTVIVME
jgi:hypothetical protein